MSQCPCLAMLWADKSARLWPGRQAYSTVSPGVSHRGRWVASLVWMSP